MLGSAAKRRASPLHPRRAEVRSSACRQGTTASGEVAEWSIASHSKCEVRATVPGVRIPPSPPYHSPLIARRLTEELPPLAKNQVFGNSPANRLASATGPYGNAARTGACPGEGRERSGLFCLPASGRTGRGAGVHRFGNPVRPIPGALCWPTFGRPMLAWFQISADAARASEAPSKSAPPLPSIDRWRW